MAPHVFFLMDHSGTEYNGYVNDQSELVILSKEDGRELATIPGRVCYNVEKCQELNEDLEETGINIPFAMEAEDDQAREILTENGFFILPGATPGDGLVYPIREIGMTPLKEFLQTAHGRSKVKSPMAP